MNYTMNSLISFLVCILFIMVSVAYVTLFERKLLSYCQRRKGPNKVGLKGLTQPISDAIKLFSKESFSPTEVSGFEFYLGPGLFFIASLFMWWPCPLMPGGDSNLKLFFMFMFCVSSFMGLMIFSMGWISFSKYAVIGSLRAIAQVVSYEVVIVLLVFMPMSVVGSFSGQVMGEYSMWFVGSSFLCFFMWYMSCLAELNRAPFDFVEGESELVSGFNVEYGGVSFAVIFMGEYGMIIFMSVVTCFLFFGGFISLYFCSIYWFVSTMLVCGNIYLFILARASFPRYRYDLLMLMVWKNYLPMCLGLTLLIFVLI